MNKTFSEEYLTKTMTILTMLDVNEIEKIILGINDIGNCGGKLFILGVGGSAATASHAVNDFRKICNIPTFAPTDNVAELTARINDDGWENCFSTYLENEDLSDVDAILILSVGGGSIEKNISMNLVNAINLAKTRQCKIYGIVGRDGGYTKQNADACVVIPPVVANHITPHTEGICGVILHLMVSHPALKRSQTKWESTK